MAVIGKIRKHSGLLIIIIGVALAAFVLGDISKTQGRRSNNVGSVNGEEITYKDFGNRVEENLQYQKQQQRKQNLTSAEAFFVREQTWNQFVNEILLNEEYESLGLAVSKEELADLLYGSNIHYLVRQNFADPQTGEFSPDRILNFLNNDLNRLGTAERQQYFQFEQAIKRDQVNTKFNNLIRKGYYVPESIAEQMAKHNTVTANVNMLAKNISMVSDSLITITDAELKDYYKESIEDYQLEEETRAIDYVVFEVVPSVNDRTETTEVVNELFDEFLTAADPVTFVNSVSDHRYDSNFYKLSNLPIQIAEKVENAPKGTFVEPYLDNDVYYMAKLMDVQFRPDSMLASHVLIAYQGAQNSSNPRTKEQANQLADSLWRVLNRNPEKLPLIARQFSNDPSAVNNNGNLGWFPDFTMVSGFNNAIIKANVGEIVLAETQFGFHIIEVNGKKNISRKYRLAIIDRAIEASSQTYQDYWTMASKFAAENTDHESFTEAVANLGLNKRTFPNMTRMTSSIYDLDYPRQIVRWAFSDDVEVGSISPILDFNGKYVITMLTDIENEGARDFERIKDEVEVKAREQKKIQYILDEIEGVNGFDQIAQKWDVTSENIDVNFNLAMLGSQGVEPKVAGEIFGMQNNQVSTIVSERGVYVIKLVEIKTPEAVANLDGFKSQLSSSFQNRIYQNAIITALREAAEIEDNRYLFY